MHDATKRVRQALMSKYRSPTFAVPIAMRERPRRVQFRALMPETDQQFIEPLPDPGPADPMMLGGMLGQAMDMSGVPLPGMEGGSPGMGGGDPMAGAGGAQVATQMAAMPPDPGPMPMMAPEGLPAGPGAPTAQTRVPAQAGPGVNPQQILAALFGA